MRSVKRETGDLGEDRACEFLIAQGYKILDRNYRVKNLGELDIVGRRGNKLYFFEVKTRDKKHEINFPIQFSIDFKKRSNLKRICDLYLRDKKFSPNQEWQVDGVFVKMDHGDRTYDVEHLENILWEEYY